MAVSQSLTVTEVAGSVDTAANTSKVQIKWTSTQSDDSWNGYTRTAYYWISINGGAETKYSVSYTLPMSSTKTIVSKTITVAHKSDGSGTVKVRTWMDTDISAGVVEKSKTINLTVIPRATKLDSLSCSTSYFTGTITYKYTPKSSAMYNRCSISLNLNGEYFSVKKVNLGNKAASQQTATVTLSADELAIIYNKLPSTTRGTLRFALRTYSDSGYSNQVGDTSVKEMTLNIPDNSSTKPTVDMSLAPVGSLPDAFAGLYIKGKTKVKATLTAAPKYSATTESYSMKVDGVSYGSSASYTSVTLSKYGTFAVTGYATDSRGFTGSMSKNINVIDYAKPKILDVEAFRCDASGNAADSRTYLKIKAKRSYSKVVSSGVQKNFCAIRYRWKPANGSYSSWTTILAKDASSDEVTTGALLSGALDAKTTYVVQVQAYDDIGEHAETEVSVLTETVYMHRTKNAMGLGMYAEGENVLSVAWDAHFHGDVKIGNMTLREYILSIIEGG